MKKICLTLLTSLTVLSVAAKAEIVSDIYFTQGIAVPGGAGNIFDYWRTGYSASLGAKLPHSFIRGWVQNWLDFSYAYLPFDRNSEFPVSYPYSPKPKMWGDGVNLFSMGLNLRIISPNPGIVKGYFLGGLGYMKRSKTNIYSNSADYPRFETTYGGAGFFSLGFGMYINLGDRLSLFSDVQYMVANTSPGKTALLPLRLGLIFNSIQKQ